MESRKLGSNGPNISVIGFGCWAMGGAGWESGWGAQDDDASVEAIHAALDHGVTWFDTAAVYGLGHSEDVLAKALGARRKDVVVATKCGLVWDAQKNINTNGLYDSIMREADASLRRLNTDYIDLYQMHWPDADTKAPPEETMRAMDDLIKAGKIRYAGVSNYDVPLLEKSLTVRHVDSLQPPYSMFDRAVEEAVLPFCLSHGIGVVAYSPLASGLLGGRYDETQTFADDDWRSRDPRFIGEGLKRNLAIVDRLRPIASDLGVSVPQLAIAWVLAHPALTSAIVGVRKVSHILDALPAADLRLDASTLSAIETALNVPSTATA